jgi:hypothetical protein
MSWSTTGHIDCLHAGNTTEMFFTNEQTNVWVLAIFPGFVLYRQQSLFVSVFLLETHIVYIYSNRNRNWRDNKTTTTAEYIYRGISYVYADTQKRHSLAKIPPPKRWCLSKDVDLMNKKIKRFVKKNRQLCCVLSSKYTVNWPHTHHITPPRHEGKYIYPHFNLSMPLPHTIGFY